MFASTLEVSVALVDISTDETEPSEVGNSQVRICLL